MGRLGLGNRTLSGRSIRRSIRRFFKADDFFSDDGSHDRLDSRSSDRRGSRSSDLRASRSEDRYGDHEYYEDYEMTYEEHKSLIGNNRCVSIPKLAIFFLFLGLTFGLVFGLVDLDRINNVINNGSGGTQPTTDDGTDDDANTITDDGTIQPPYVFKQCPVNGECCNGLASNCDFRPNELMWATVHNANHDEKLLANHEAPLEQALEAGYRGLMMDACFCINGNGNLEFQFCHLLCGVGYRDPAEVFANIGTFLDNNPTEIIFINLEISHGNPTTDLIWQAIIAAGLRQRTYIHGDYNFPTLRNLLMDGRQLIIAKHNGYDCTDFTLEGCARRIFEYFNEVIETHYSFDSVEAIENTATSCPGYRGVNGNKRFYSINNFVTSTLGPNKLAANIINKKPFLEKRIADCEAITGYEVNFVSVDYWQRGDLPQVTQEINLARAQRSRSWLDPIINWLYH